VWNGINLQSPLNGSFDLNLMPNFFMGRLSVLYGGEGPVYGSGSEGGSILMRNLPAFNQPLEGEFLMGYGSFGFMNYGAGLSWGGKHFYNSTKFLYTKSDNDFQFTNTAQPGSPVDTLQNAGFRQYGIQQLNSFKWGRGNQLDFRFTHLITQRGIPPTMLEAVSAAKQKDYNTRAMLQWRRKMGKWDFKVKTAYFDEVNLYRDTISKIDGDNRGWVWLVEPEVNVKISKLARIDGGVRFDYTKGNGSTYENANRKEMALYGSLVLNNVSRTLSGYLNLRQSVVDGIWIPFLPSMGIKWKFLPAFIFKTHAGRLYRLPAFNDLYWVPGGNINLQPEKGWNTEMTVSWNHQSGEKGKMETGISATAFSRNMAELIVWQPAGFYWEAVNEGKVWSRGFEFSGNIRLGFGEFKILGMVNGTWLKSTNEGNDLSKKGKQLIYTPGMKWNTVLGIVYKSWQLEYTHQFTGNRFTTADNEESMPAFSTGNIDLRYAGHMQSSGIQVYFQIKNIWDNAYQVIAYRPMPGIHFELGLNLKLVNQNNY
jgi:iron complex outermembrane recepter protein